MLSIGLLRIFVSVAENSSFTRAAGEMYRSQSAISMQIKRLEDIVGAQVFARSGKSVELTPEGQIFLDYARRIIRLTDEALSAVHMKGHGKLVRLGCIEDYAGRVIPPIMARFWKEQPDVQIEVRTGETAQLLDRLDVDYDLVIAAHPAGSNEGRTICSDRLVWAIAPDHAPHKQVPIPVAVRSEAELDRQWSAAVLDAAGLSWRHTYLPSGIGTLQAAVEDGLAVGVFKLATVPDNLRILREEDGFPELPHIDIALHLAPGAAARSEVQQLGDAISRSLARVQDKFELVFPDD
jgi:DNA-binding transcriptional LysR family regulator